MKAPARVTARRRPKWLLAALAAAWIMLSLAVGSAIQRDVTDAAESQSISTGSQL
jgi:hypothetical protein